MLVIAEGEDTDGLAPPLDPPRGRARDGITADAGAGRHTGIPGGPFAVGAQLRPGDYRAQSLRAAFYGIGSGEDDKRFLSELQAVEPSNAQTLVALVERERGLRQSYDRIEHASGLIRPIVAAEDVTADKTGARRQIAYTVFDSFALQLDLSFAAAVYGLAGLFLGSLIGELLTRCSATASRPCAKMNRLLTASRLLADFPLTKVDWRQIEFR